MLLGYWLLANSNWPCLVCYPVVGQSYIFYLIMGCRNVSSVFSYCLSVICYLFMLCFVEKTAAMYFYSMLRCSSHQWRKKNVYIYICIHVYISIHIYLCI